MKTLNFIFSLVFLFWCFTILINSNIKSKTKKWFHYGMEEKEFYFFWEFIIFTTVFNILARILNRCNFYLIGAFGFIILSLTQCICFIFFIKNSINDFSNQSENDKHDDGVQSLSTLSTFPFIFFGILSSLYCYHTKIHQSNNQTKLQKLFLRKIPLTNYQNIILVFNFMVSLSAATLLFCIFFESKMFECISIICLFPFFPTIVYSLALKFRKNIFYRLTIICWAIFAVIVTVFFCPFMIDIITINRKQNLINEFIEILPFFLTFFIHAIIGIFSSLTIFRSHQKSENELIESCFDNQNFVPSENSIVVYPFEQPPINYNPEIFDV